MLQKVASGHAIHPGALVPEIMKPKGRIMKMNCTGRLVVSFVLCGWVVSAETVTKELLLNLYDAPNITYRSVGRLQSGRADIRGIFTGMNTTAGWVPLRYVDILAEAVYTQELSLDRIELVFDDQKNTMLGTASRIEYTNSTSGGWVTLIDGIDATGSYDRGVDFEVASVRGLRWSLPSENWTTNSSSSFFGGNLSEPFAPQFRRLYAYGTNTVPIDRKLNLVHAKAVSITTNAVWGTAFPTGRPDEIGDQIGHVMAFSRNDSPPADAWLQIELDRPYRFDAFLLHWGRNADVRQSPNSYDISVSMNGVDWILAVDDHNATVDAWTSAQISDVSDREPPVVGKFIRLHDLKGQAGSRTVALAEVQAYGTLVPPAASVILIR